MILFISSIFNMTYDLHNAGNNNNIAPSKTLSTPNNNHTSSEMAVSVSNLTLTAEIFNNNNKIGKTKGKARIDIKVALPLSEAEMTETKVKTTEIPNIPKADPMANNPKSLTGKLENNPIKNIIMRKIPHKNRKL